MATAALVDSECKTYCVPHYPENHGGRHDGPRCGQSDARIVPAVELHCASPALRQHHSPALSRADSANMDDVRDRGKMRLPAALPCAIAEIDLLPVHEERFIETADRVERAPPDDQCRPGDPWHDTRAIVGPSSQTSFAEPRNVHQHTVHRVLSKRRS